MFEPIEIKRSGDLVRFLREDDNGKKVKTVLLGNGFCLDHPTLKEVFIFNKSDKQAISQSINEAEKKSLTEWLNQEKKECPEKFLDRVRLHVSKEI